MKKNKKKIIGMLNEAQKQINAKNWSHAKNLILETGLANRDNFAVIFQLGWCLMHLGRPDQALPLIRRVESICDKNSVVLNSVALAYIFMHQWEHASRVLQRALEVDPSNIDSYLNLAAVYSNLGQHKKTLDVSLKAVALDISNESAHLNMGSALIGLGFSEEAKVAFETCLTLAPHNLDAYLNLAVLNSREVEPIQSVKKYEKYIQLAYVASHEKLNLGRYYSSYEYLRLGDLVNGWRMYEYGFDPSVPAYVARAPARQFSVPRWEGKPIPGKRLLVWAEQGLGDEILFLSCMRDLLEHCGDIILECAPRLVEVMARSFPSITVRPSAYSRDNFYLPLFADFDFQIPLGSLPSLFRQSLEDFSHFMPYVVTNVEKRDVFSSRLSLFERKLKVGICWRSGMLSAERNSGYSAIRDWGDLLKLQNCIFVNLQYGECESEITEVEALFGITILRWNDLDLKNDIDNVYALLDCLDLVVTAATAVNPMAGSIGKATFLLQDSWGWPNIGTDYYPWFPNTRCFVPESGNSPAEVIPSIAAIVANIANLSSK
jgi:tetratricopeptide (TPR) repeat protein